MEQARNKRTTRFIEAFGQRLSLAEWADRMGVPEARIRARLDKLGLSPAEALGLPKYRKTTVATDWGKKK